MADPEPVDASVFETLHQAQFIAEKAQHTEYGRLLKAWMKNQGDYIFREWYVGKVSRAKRVSSTERDWLLLREAAQPFASDEELFKIVAGMDDYPCAVDEHGNWRIQAPAALQIATQNIDRLQRNLRDRTQWMYLLAAVAILALIGRFT